MPIKFHQTQVTISGTDMNFLAESVSVDESNSLAPTPFLGYRGPTNFSPNGGVRNSISIDYLIEPYKDINFDLVNSLRNYNVNYFPIPCIVGGLTGSVYLENYSLTILPNDIVKGTVSYIGFSELSGVMTAAHSSIHATYNQKNGSGLAHYWSTHTKTFVSFTTTSVDDDGVGLLTFYASFGMLLSPGSIVTIGINGLGIDVGNYTVISSTVSSIIVAGGTALGSGSYVESISIDAAIQAGSIIQANYSFKANWQPIYKIGQPTPVEVKFMGGEESFNFLSEYSKNINFSGQSFSERFTDFDIIEINPISTTWGVGGNRLILYPSSGRIISNKISVSENNLVLQETSIIKSY